MLLKLIVRGNPHTPMHMFSLIVLADKHRVTNVTAQQLLPIWILQEIPLLRTFQMGQSTQ
jgi:hypothetical protein